LKNSLSPLRAHSSSARRAITLLSLCACLSLALLQPTSAHAEDLDFTQAKVRFSSYKQQLTRLQTAPQARYLVGELSSLNQWVARAERELAEDEEDSFKSLVDLIQLQIQLIDVSIEELIARDRVDAVERGAADLEARAKTEREAIVNLERELGGQLSAPAQRRPQAQAAPATAPKAKPAQAKPTPQAQPTPRLAPAPSAAPTPAP